MSAKAVPSQIQPGSKDQWGYHPHVVQDAMHRIAQQVRHVLFPHPTTVVLRGAAKDPEHMAPPVTIQRAVRISGFIRKLVVNTVLADPFKGAPLSCQVTKKGEEVL